jgi:hypothetical protein
VPIVALRHALCDIAYRTLPPVAARWWDVAVQHVAAGSRPSERATSAVEMDDGCRVGIDPTSTWFRLVDRLPRRARRSTGETR